MVCLINNWRIIVEKIIYRAYKKDICNYKEKLLYL